MSLGSFFSWKLQEYVAEPSKDYSIFIHMHKNGGDHLPSVFSLIFPKPNKMP